MRYLTPETRQSSTGAARAGPPPDVDLQGRPREAAPHERTADRPRPVPGGGLPGRARGSPARRPGRGARGLRAARQRAAGDLGGDARGRRSARRHVGDPPPAAAAPEPAPAVAAHRPEHGAGGGDVAERGARTASPAPCSTCPTRRYGDDDDVQPGDRPRPRPSGTATCTRRSRRRCATTTRTSWRTARATCSGTSPCTRTTCCGSCPAATCGANTAEENAQLRADPRVPLPNARADPPAAGRRRGLHPADPALGQLLPGEAAALHPRRLRALRAGPRPVVPAAPVAVRARGVRALDGAHRPRVRALPRRPSAPRWPATRGAYRTALDAIHPGRGPQGPNALPPST